MTREEVAEDVAYVRTLAAEGRHAPLLGGPYLVLFGVLLSIAYSAEWLMLSGAAPGLNPGWIWGTFGLVAFASAMLLRLRVRAMPGGSSLPNRSDRTVWSAVSWAS